MLGAVLAALVQQCLGPAADSEPCLLLAADLEATSLTPEDYEQLWADSSECPQPEQYEALGELCRQQGDLRRALFYLRKASVAAEAQRAED